MHFLRELSSEKLLHCMNEGFVDKNNAAEIAHFSDCVLHNKIPLLSFVDAKENCITVEAAIQSGFKLAKSNARHWNIVGQRLNACAPRTNIGVRMQRNAALMR